MSVFTALPLYPNAGLRSDWADAAPLITWGPTFGWNFTGERPVTPRWRIARFQMLSFLRGYEARWRAIRAITTDEASNDSGTGTVWSGPRRRAIKTVALLLLGRVRFDWPDSKSFADELACYDGSSDGYSWSATFLHVPAGFRLGAVHISNDGDSTY